MFLYEIVNDKKDNHEYIEVTGYEGSVTNLVIPDEIDGIRVESIGSHAFSARDDIVSVQIPETVRILRSYVFHNSRNLRKISLHDSIDDYYDGVVRQCDSLEEVDITIDRSWFEVMRNFLADSDRAIRFVIHDKSVTPIDLDRENAGTKGIDAMLSFPGYVYDFNENTMARTIQFSIAGAGYAYRECVDRRKIDFRQYDSLFAKAMIDGGSICQDIAIGRLLYPLELDERFERAYAEYVRDNGADILKRFIDLAVKDTEQMAFLGKLLEKEDKTYDLFSDKDIEKAVEYASTKDSPAVTSLFMEKTRSVSSSNEFSFEF